MNQPRMPFHLISLGFLLVVQASASQNETTPDPRWVPNPDRRGTANILETCLFTIFLCTWTVLHLNVPAVGDGFAKRLVRKIKWMMITMMLPEWTFSIAMQERITAKRQTE